MAEWFPSGQPEASRSREAITIALLRKKKRFPKEKSRIRQVTTIKATTTGASHSCQIRHKLGTRRIVGSFLFSSDTLALSIKSAPSLDASDNVRLERIGARY